MYSYIIDVLFNRINIKRLYYAVCSLFVFEYMEVMHHALLRIDLYSIFYIYVFNLLPTYNIMIIIYIQL